ncbi:MAG: hypothetical protein WBM86_28475, partial [Waterburya sp.]
LHQYKKTKYFEVGNQFNALLPLTFALYPHSTDKLHIRCKISVIDIVLKRDNAVLGVSPMSDCRKKGS